ncbi:MAG: phosphodiesterase [Methyloligellaceae bacterium]
MMKFLHFTDPHLVGPGEILWGNDTANRMDRCLNDMVEGHRDAEFCVLTGDITDNGGEAAYEWMANRLETFPIRTILLLGNHDDRRTFYRYFPDTPTDDHGFVQQSYRTDAEVFLFLDTLKHSKVSEGQYCSKRHEWFRRQLSDAGDKPVYIFMHHPPFDVGMAYMDRIKLDEAEKFADTIRYGHNVQHIFFGHIHRATFVKWHGISCSSLPGLNHQVPLVRERVGTAYCQEPAMYGVVHLEKEQMTIHHEAFLHRAPVPMA